MGALTLKSFPFELRSWDIEKFESIDPTDGFGSGTRVYINKQQIVQIEPDSNETTTNAWLSDKGRQFFENRKYIFSIKNSDNYYELDTTRKYSSVAVFTFEDGKEYGMNYIDFHRIFKPVEYKMGYKSSDIGTVDLYIKSFWYAILVYLSSEDVVRFKSPARVGAPDICKVEIIHMDRGESRIIASLSADEFYKHFKLWPFHSFNKTVSYRVRITDTRDFFYAGDL